ncbi:MAG: prealbumin-like fold domain-containing protein [Oscillospiraceae bacterium]|nr:prealbumin-like fold domain-containing protein [Oscillospiraceae bacterium]
MDFRDVPLDGSAPSSWAPYHEGESDEENYVITLGNTTGHSLSGAFQNLPMYVTRSDGTVCRREYSVVEQSYTVWENGRIVASFDGTTYFPDDNHKYALWYQHDAGEDDNYSDTDYPDEEDYNIMVYNMHENRTTLKDIGLTINKVWKDADGHVISEIPDNYKTRFVLKRKVIVEYRNYENESTPRDQWVWVKLIAGSHEQMLQVPPGRLMFIRGNILKDKDPGLIVFRDSNNVEYQASMDDDPQFKDYNLFKIPFNAPSQSSAYTSETNPFEVRLINGSDLAVGRDDGFILSDSNDRQVIGVDSTFSKEFELSNEKGWTKVFPKTGSASGSDDPQEQFENEHPLPAIEVSTLDASGNTANTYIYTYYFEEVECIPDSFYATFTDSSNNLIGGASQPFYSDETITATNRPIGLEVLKVDQDKTTRTLPGAVFKLRKLDDGPNGSYPVSTNNGTFGGTEYDTQTTAQGTGKASFSRRPLPSGTEFLQGLLPGYYEVKETKAPDGYVLTENVVFYVYVEKTGLVKLLKKQEVQDQEGVFTLSEAGANELVGKATLSAEQTANGQTIVITVRNEPGVELPSSGGPGTKMIYLLGGILTAASLLLFIRKRIME